MHYTLNEPPRRHDVVTIPVLWLAIALSLLVHLLALLTMPAALRPKDPQIGERDGKAGTLVATLVPRATPQASLPPPSTPAPPPQARPEAAAPARRPPPPAPARPPSRPPVLAAPASPGPPAPAPEAPRPTPAPPRPPQETDLAAYIESRRRARGETTTTSGDGRTANAAPAETEIERRNRIVAANLGGNERPTFGTEARGGGGIFQIRRIGFLDAEFVFNGWSKDIKRQTKQVFEVRRGDAPDIRTAVIRRMIAIIRETQEGDFVWLSNRRGQLTMSARPADNDKLEAFLMDEFFGDPQRQN